MVVLSSRPLTIAVLIKQVPRFDALRLGADGHLARAGVELEMNPYCRRAVSKGVELAQDTGGRCCVATMGPPSAEDCLREAVAWGADEGVLISDPAFAGSDTLATARVLATALRKLGPFDLILCGRNSVDADTAQTPAQLAELLGLPMAAGVRRLDVFGEVLELYCEHDDGWIEASLALPALLTCAERLSDPAKVAPDGRAAVSLDRIRRLDAAALGPGLWGRAGSPTVVGAVKHLGAPRLRMRFEGDVDAQVEQAVSALALHGAFKPGVSKPAESVPPARVAASAGVVAVFVEPERVRATRELLGSAARLALVPGGPVVALTAQPLDAATAGSWGADVVVTVDGADTEEDIAAAFAAWCGDHPPWAVLAPSTMWGREVAGRVAVRQGAGLAGDVVALDTDENGRLVCWKPASGGELVAAVTFRSPVQMVTVRSGVLPLPVPRAVRAQMASAFAVAPRNRVRIAKRIRDDDIDTLATARAVVAVGAAVAPEEYPQLRPLLDVLGAELAATRKVTDLGWQPRARQVGITGRNLAPRLFVAIGSSGKFNHIVGARQASLIVAVNDDPQAPVFDAADIGIVADWREAVPRLADAVAARLGVFSAPMTR